MTRCGAAVKLFQRFAIIMFFSYRYWRIGSVEYLQISEMCFHFNLPRVIDGEFDHMILSGRKSGTHRNLGCFTLAKGWVYPVSYTHLRSHDTRHELVCRLLLEKKNTIIPHNFFLIGIPVTTNQLEIIFYCH